VSAPEFYDQNEAEAQPPRLPIGAPLRRTLAPQISQHSGPSRTSQPTPNPSQEGNHADVLEGNLPSAGGAGGGYATSTGNAVVVSEPSEPQPPVIPQNLPVPSRLRRVLFAPVKFFWGMALCQSVIGALAVLGWTYRLMQRVVLKQWWKASDSSIKGADFASFAGGDTRTDGHVHWPNWFLAQNFRAGARRRQGTPMLAHWLVVAKALGDSLWRNVRLGVQGIFNTGVFTLPACALMLFGWYDGWNNSFNKGYEQFWVGPAVSWLGIMLFIGAMLYVPMAQARQAVTGNWRSFYQFRLVWTLVRRRWLACFGLALLYVLGSIPLMILSGVVMFLPNINAKWADLTPAQTIQVLNSYYFWWALFVFPAFVLLRLVAARTYGTALLKAVQTGAIPQDALAEPEWQAFHRLELLLVEPPRLRHPVLRIVAWAGTRAGRITFGFLTFLAWFIFVGQLYIAQFFNYRGGPVWLNQTLIHLPWYHHLPVALKNPWGDFLAAAAVVFIAWRLAKVVRWLKKLRHR